MPEPTTTMLSGNFLPVAAAFKGSPQGIANALKVEVRPITLIEHAPDGQVKQTFGLNTVTTRALLDFAAVKPQDIDFDKLQIDCELMSRAICNQPDALRQALELICSDKATEETVRSAAAALDKAGITEKAFQEQGGGLVGLLLVIGAALLMGACYEECPKPYPTPRTPADVH